MELSAEERRRIYEEEKARIEAEPQGSPDQKVLSTARGNSGGSTRALRITSSSVAIAWSIALLVIFYIFRHYLAYYQIEQIDGVNRWVRYEILTTGFQSWLPVLTTTLVLSIIGHIIAIIYDRYIIRQSIITALNIFGIATVAYLLALFPFNFSPVPDGGNLILSALVRVVLVAILVIMGIITLINLVKLIARVATKTAAY